MKADRSHVHHRLIDMGLNQKQAVAILYVISAILGLSAVVLATSGEIKALVTLVTLAAVALIAYKAVFPKEKLHPADPVVQEQTASEDKPQEEPKEKD